MESYIQDWLNLIFRWLHVTAGIAWIGASFYFNWLEGRLENAPQAKQKKGIKGELWAVHGGGFYEVNKYHLAPEKMPETLHWFKWEAYVTWLSGFALLAIIYYWGAESYLLASDSPLSPASAIAISAFSLFVSWLVYDLLCRTPLFSNEKLFSAVLFGLIVIAAWGYTQLFSDRAAYIHVGALIGTLMVGNVFQIIIPSQRKLVDAAQSGDSSFDPAIARHALLRSRHNNYFTLPLLFIMISGHYPMTYGHDLSWAILAALSLAAILIRHFFNRRNQGTVLTWLWPAAAVVMLSLAFVIRPQTAPMSGVAKAPAFDEKEIVEIVTSRCSTCHGAKPTDPLFQAAPGGLIFDDYDSIASKADKIYSQAVQTQVMPLANRTEMTEEERQILGQWYHQLKSE
ncbi:MULTISPECIES: urate hydroxylase PuuD [unclassified Endozoicomonas]|uniref:urate hydroxylase PuuD n=1 Tax=unclassified Endozoicomonas TaxID=2644528 RepID=UPI002147E353|nr:MULTISPECIES: urate hydroxylase PuuD [unclassified Endozoicomonas]